MLLVCFTMTTFPLAPFLALNYENLVEFLEIKLMEVWEPPKNVAPGVSHFQASPHFASINSSHLRTSAQINIWLQWLHYR